MPLTVKELEALTAADKGRLLPDGKSLKGMVYVARDGAVSVQFRFAYKFAGKSKTILVGTWPKTGLAEIRRQREALGVLISGGIDPVAQRREEADKVEAAREAERIRQQADQQQAILEQKQRLQDIAAKNARITVRELFNQWKTLELVRRADMGSETQRSFTRDVLPLTGDMAVEDVKKAHIHEILDTIKARATPNNNMVRTAKKTLSDMRQMFCFAMDRDYIEADPTARVKKSGLGKDEEGERALLEPEIVELFQKLPEAGLIETSQLALLIQLSTGVRISELLGAQWSNIDTDRRTWRLPETKNGKAHDVWLSEFALDKFQRLRGITGGGVWAFPASRKPGQPVCKKTVTKQVTDRQRTGGAMSGRSKRVQALTLPGGRWTPHDLRRTAATIMAELGSLPEVVEKCLNHKEEKRMKRIYQRAQYLGPMREAWEVLGKRLEMLEVKALGVADNVVSLRAA